MADNDFGSLLADVSAPTTTDTDTTGLNLTEDKTGADETVDLQDLTAEKADGEGEQDKTEAESEDKTDKTDKTEKGPIPPAKVQAALKALRDSDPANAPVVAALKDAYGRSLAYAKVFPKVAEAQEAKTTLEVLGGAEGIAKLQDTVATVNATDQALYAGKKEVIQQIYDDCVANKHPEAFGKLAPHFLDTLASKDAAAYESVMAPRHLTFLNSVNFPGVVNALGKAIAAKDFATADSVIKEMARFYTEFKEGIKQPAANPEKEAWEKEKEEHQTAQKTQFNEALATSANSGNVLAIKDALKPYVKGNPYFKSWTPRMMNNLGADVHRELYTQLKKDGTYKAQMKALHSVANPNKDEILKYHKSAVALKIARITKEVLDRDYSGYAKKTIKPGTPGATDKTKQQVTVQGSAPVLLSAEPKREDIDWEKDPRGNLYTVNKAYLKKTGRLVTWK